MSKKNKNEREKGVSISKAEALEIVDDAFLCAKALDGWSLISAKELERVSRHDEDMETWCRKSLLTCVEKQEYFASFMPRSVLQSIERKTRGWKLQSTMNGEPFKRKDARAVAESAKRLEYTVLAYFES